MLDAVTQLLNYCATHPDAVVRFTESDMKLDVISDASFLTVPKARSRIAGYFHLIRKPKHATGIPLADAPAPPLNGPIDVNVEIFKAVLASAAEAELGGLFSNAKKAVAFRTTLEEMGHPQSATLVQTDNACAAGIANKSVKQRRSRAFDMRFYWVQDRVEQGDFLVYWRQGSDNAADYFTKHHSPAHHRRMRSRYLYSKTPYSAAFLQCGCVDTGIPDDAPSVLRTASGIHPMSYSEPVIGIQNPLYCKPALSLVDRAHIQHFTTDTTVSTHNRIKH